MSIEIEAEGKRTVSDSVAQIITMAAVIGGVAAVVWFGFPLMRMPSATPAPVKVVGLTTSLAGIPLKGSPSAKAVVVEFSDFQCPFCARFATSVQPELTAKFVDSGRVAWAFRHLPLAEIHPQAVNAAEVAECASRLGQFWEAHDALFRNQPALATQAPLALVQPILTNGAVLAACVDHGQARERLAADLKEASRLGLRGTPAFVLGSRQPDGTVRIAGTLAGALSAPEFARALDALVLQYDNTGTR